MSTVAEIKAAIATLSVAERSEIVRSAQEMDCDDWDREMAADAEPGGKLDRLVAAAEAEAKAGTLREFPGRRRE